MVWTVDGPQGKESEKIAPFLVPYTRGRVLDIGAGQHHTFPHFITVDSGKDYGGQKVSDVQARSSQVAEIFAPESMDAVFSSHCLEHLEDTRAALKAWWSLVKVGGHLVLYLPHAKFYPRIGEIGGNPDHKHDFLPDDIINHMREVGTDWTLVENEDRNEENEYSFFQVFRKEKEGAGQVIDPWRRKENSCLVIRYGAVGDHLIASSVLPLLKEKFDWLAYNTTPNGKYLLEACPYIDEFIVQDTDQVPNVNLGPYWDKISERYDVTYNLSESIEGLLLPPSGRFNHDWPDPVRRKVMGTVNYIERTHDLCDVPFRPNPRFYETAKERTWARKQKARISRNGRCPVILWALAGSSLHKMWPHIDQAWARLMLETNARIVTCGDVLCQMLECGWEEEKRIFRRAGQWTMRQTLAFAQQADIVVGPETGVLNAVSMIPGVAKVVYLSHSSETNLTRDWVNASVLLPTVPCYPCHRLHYPGSKTCPRDPRNDEQGGTGAALCALSITPDDMLLPIYEHIGALAKAA